jgi:hypothetical protein
MFLKLKEASFSFYLVDIPLNFQRNLGAGMTLVLFLPTCLLQMRKPRFKEV